MKHYAWGVLAAGVMGWYAPAEAGVFELDARLHAGAMLGQGVFGDLDDQAFYDDVSGLGYGVRVGAELLFVDAWIQHDQYLDGGVAGTFTQLMLGFDARFDFGERVGRDASSPEGEGYSRTYAEVGVCAGFGVATRAQVEPPLSDDEITDKGLIADLELGFGYRLTRILSVGVQIPVHAGYFSVSKDDAVANNLDNHYGAVNAAALLSLRINLSL
jgi:hypothetical protein